MFALKMDNCEIPQKVSPYLALFALLFHKSKYCELAIKDYQAIEFEDQRTKDPEILEKFKSGAWPSNETKEQLRIAAGKSAKSIQRNVCRSLLALAITVCAAGLLAYCFGKLSSALPVSWPKAISTLGAFLAAWATVIELGSPETTWGGESLPERIHPALFRVLFLPGTFLAFTGQLMG